MMSNDQDSILIQVFLITACRYCSLELYWCVHWTKLLPISCLPFLMLMDLIIEDSFMFFHMTHWNSCRTLSCRMVYHQYEFFHVRVYTILTAERFFIGTNSFMCLQMLWLTELLCTLWAAEWFLASVNSFISLLVIVIAEVIFTLWAAE